MLNIPQACIKSYVLGYVENGSHLQMQLFKPQPQSQRAVRDSLDLGKQDKDKKRKEQNRRSLSSLY